MNIDSNLITVKETAGYLKLNPLTVYDYIHSCVLSNSDGITG